MPDIGLTFAPTSDPMTASHGQSNQSSPVQDAIRILSFRLPTVLGAGAITPAQNMGPSYGLGDSVIQNWLRQLMLGAGGGGSVGSPYGDLFGGGGQSGSSTPPSGGLPPSIIVNQPRPQMGSPEPQPSPMPMPSPFPDNSGGRGPSTY